MTPKSVSHNRSRLQYKTNFVYNVKSLNCEVAKEEQFLRLEGGGKSVWLSNTFQKDVTSGQIRYNKRRDAFGNQTKRIMTHREL